MRHNFMKQFVVLFCALGAFLLAGCRTSQPARVYKTTFSSFDLPTEHRAETLTSNGVVNFKGVALDQVLEIYQELSGRTVIRGQLPEVRINLQTKTPLNRIQMLQVLDSVLAENGIVMVLSGDMAVKVVAAAAVNTASPPEITRSWEQLPDSSSYMMRTVRLKYVQPSMVVPVLAPFSRLPNSLVCIDGEHLLMLRDYAANIRQELQMLEKMDKPKSP